MAKGLERAGFEVWGVDIKRQPRYCGDHFVQADALNPPWASPPCQAYTVSRTRSPIRKDHPKLINATIAMLVAAGVPWCVENVPGAPLPGAVTLCGSSFGLGAQCADGIRRSLRRHRWFQCSFAILVPPCQCDRKEKIGVYGNGGRWQNRFDPARKGYKGCVSESREALDMPWATIAELSQAIPPAYSRFIAQAALRQLGWTERAAA